MTSPYHQNPSKATTQSLLHGCLPSHSFFSGEKGAKFCAKQPRLSFIFWAIGTFVGLEKSQLRTYILGRWRCTGISLYPALDVGCFAGLEAIAMMMMFTG